MHMLPVAYAATSLGSVGRREDMQTMRDEVDMTDNCLDLTPSLRLHESIACFGSFGATQRITTTGTETGRCRTFLDGTECVANAPLDRQLTFFEATCSWRFEIYNLFPRWGYLSMYNWRGYL